MLFNSREGQNIILTSLNLLDKDKISVHKLDDITENQHSSVIILRCVPLSLENGVFIMTSKVQIFLWKKINRINNILAYVN